MTARVFPRNDHFGERQFSAGKVQPFGRVLPKPPSDRYAHRTSVNYRLPLENIPLSLETFLFLNSDSMESKAALSL